jgi:hypothetical protein
VTANQVQRQLVSISVVKAPVLQHKRCSTGSTANGVYWAASGHAFCKNDRHQCSCGCSPACATSILKTVGESGPTCSTCRHRTDAVCSSSLSNGSLLPMPTHACLGKAAADCAGPRVWFPDICQGYRTAKLVLLTVESQGTNFSDIAGVQQPGLRVSQPQQA